MPENTYVQVPPDDTGAKVDATSYSLAASTSQGTLYRQHMSGGSIKKLTTASFTRPVNVTTYTAGDAITGSSSATTPLTFSAAGRSSTGGSGYISAARLFDGCNMSTSLALSAELYIFHNSTGPVSPIDNAAIAFSNAEAATIAGVVTFSTSQAYITDAGSSAAGNVSYMGLLNGQTGARIPFTSGTTGGDIYGILVARNAYIPCSTSPFVISLSIDQD